MFPLQVSGSEERPDSPSDSLDGTKKGERKKEFVCQVGPSPAPSRGGIETPLTQFSSPCLLQYCEKAGEDLVPCEGQCCGMFHLQCLGVLLQPDDKVLCQECSTGEIKYKPPRLCSRRRSCSP